MTAAMKLKTLASWKESYDKPRQHIKKQRHYFPDRSLFSQTIVFPVVMYGCESWTIKRAEHWITDAFELWFMSRFLRVPWRARRSNLLAQSWGGLMEPKGSWALLSRVMAWTIRHEGENESLQGNSGDLSLEAGPLKEKEAMEGKIRWFQN